MRSKEIHNEILSEISNEYDKREGSFIYDVTMPPSQKLASLETSIEVVKEKLSIENLEGDELELRIKERTGVTRKKATYSIGQLSVNGNGTINKGDLFETDSGIRFEATETTQITTSGLVDIKCLLDGPIGNVPANQINKIPITLAGINSVTNPNSTHDGFSAESDADLLQRYYEKIQTPATSGNRHHYKAWAKEVEGVGDARVFPLWNGDNTVKVVIINSDRQPASPELVDTVQNYIDPGITGLGDGTAPLGAFCTVTSANGLNINVSFSVTKEDGYTDPQIIDVISINLTDYYKEIALKENSVSYARIGSIILNSDGVADYTNLTVNDGTSNIVVNDQEVPILGGVTIV